jgi:ubiquinone/menaquinone biosynthesis C-methylase UbiE
VDDNRTRILEQFSQQAVPFSNAAPIRDQAVLDLLVRAGGTTSRDLVLDVACGPGLVVKAFAQVADHVTGVDLTPAMIERAREHNRECPNVTLQLADVASLPFADASFSIVVSRFAFHHFPDPASVIREMQRVCMPGGRVVVCDLLASDDPRKAASFHRLEIERDHSHARALTLAELEALFDSAGLLRTPTIHGQLAIDLEELLGRSFPHRISRAELRDMYLASLADDGLGLGLEQTDRGVFGAYKTAVIVAERAR